MRRNIITELEARDLLTSERLKIIELAYDKAFDYYLWYANYLGEKGLSPMTKTARANLIHSNVICWLKKLFKEDTGVIVGDFNRIFGIVIENSLFVRFKKLTYSKGQLVTSNIPTGQSIKFDNQTLSLRALKNDIGFATAGYVLNPSQTNISNVYVMSKVNDDLLWKIDRQGITIQEKLNLSKLNKEITDNIAQAGREKPRVRIKSSKRKGA